MEENEKNVLNEELQTIFNEDSIDSLIEDGKIENQTEIENEEVTE